MTRKRKNSKDQTADEKPAVQLLVHQPSKWRNWWIRTLWTFVMIAGFMGILYAGPVYVILLVGCIQVMVYREVISIGVEPTQERNLPWNRSLHWYFLFVTNYFLYGESLIYYYKPIVLVDAFLMPLATHHRFISFSLYVIGLVFFVLDLRKGIYM
jgi:phosphatidate cytidylyltransferase